MREKRRNCSLTPLYKIPLLHQRDQSRDRVMQTNNARSFEN